MKKIISVFGAIAILFTQTVFAQNRSIISCGFSQIPDGWTVSCTNNTNSEVKTDSESVVLSFDTTASAGKARSELMSPTFALEERYINIEFGTVFTGSNEKNIKKLTLKDNNIFNALNIVTVSKGKLEFNDNEVAEVEEDTYYTINIAIDKEAENAIMYLDNNEVYDGSLSISGFNAEALYFDFRNYLSSSVKAESEWCIDYFVCRSGDDVMYSTPADEQTIFKASEMEAFEIEYSGFLHPDMFSADSYSVYRNDISVDDIAVESKDGIISLAPAEGFIAGSKYRIVMKQSKNIFGEADGEPVDVTFHMVSDSYDESANYINITLKTDTQIVEGQITEIEAEAAMQDGISCLEIYVDGALYDTVLKESTSYSLKLSEGEHEIYAVVVSQNGARKKSDTVNVIVGANTAPEISFDGYGDTAYFSISSNCVIDINVQDSDGVERLELYKDDVFVESFSDVPCSFDVSVLGLGSFELKTVAYDSYGKSSEKYLTVVLSSNYESIIFEDSDFIAVSDNYFESGMNYSNQRGFCQPGEVDEEHGTSLLIGVNEHNSQYTDGQYSYCQYPVGDAKNFVLEYDINILEKPKKGPKYCVNMGIRYTGGTIPVFMNIQDVLTSAGNNFEYELNKWYNIAFEVNQTQEKYRIYINGNLFTEQDYKAEDYASYGEIQQFRFYSPVLNDQPCTVALDNIRLKSLMYAPSVKSIGYDDQKSPEYIDSRTQNVVVYLSDGIKTDDVSSDNIKLFDSDGKECSITVTYNESDYTVTIKPTNGLMSNEEYTVVIDKSVRIPSGEEIGGDIRAVFKTSSDKISVEDVEFTTVNGSLHADVEVTNASGEYSEFYIVASIFNGEVLERTEAQKCSISSDLMTFSTEYTDMLGKKLELYVFDSVICPVVISDTIFTYGE